MNHAPSHTVLDPPLGNPVDDVGPRSVLAGGVHAARTIVWGACAAVLVLAISSLIGGGDSHALLAPGVGMRPASAVVLALLAVSLVSLGSGLRHPRLVQGGRVLAVTVVAVTVLALLLHAGVGRRTAATLAPGFLAQIDPLPTIPLASGGMLGLAMLCLHRDTRGAARLMVALALASGFAGLLGVFGHMFDAPHLYFGSGATAVAPMGMVSVLMLSIGVWCAEPDRGPVGLLIADDAGGASLRHLLPVVLVLLPALAWARVAVERAGWISVGAGGALFSAFVMALLGGLLAIDAGRLSRLDRRNRGAAFGLAALAADLERQVAARTRELSHSNAELRQEVAERRQAEQHILELNRTLAERADELEAANRELEAFSYSVSHDLRAPLRAIDGFSRIIEQQCADHLDEANHERLVRVRHNAQRMGALIDDLLNLARLTRAPLQWRQVDLSAMATELVAGLRERDPQRQVEVRIAPGLQAWGDGPLLRVALDNLLDNGWKFTQNIAAACIEFGLERVDAEAVFVIRDNGAGFDMAHAEQLFGPFQRLHGTEEFPGTGIGLATVQRIIHKHGGRIWAQAQLQQGASFRFTLPREAP